MSLLPNFCVICSGHSLVSWVSSVVTSLPFSKTLCFSVMVQIRRQPSPPPPDHGIYFSLWMLRALATATATATTTSRALDSRVFMTMVIGRKEVCLSSCEMVGVLIAPTTQHLRLYINKLTNPMFFQARTQIGEVLYILYPISYICVLPPP